MSLPSSRWTQWRQKRKLNAAMRLGFHQLFFILYSERLFFGGVKLSQMEIGTRDSDRTQNVNVTETQTLDAPTMLHDEHDL